MGLFHCLPDYFKKNSGYIYPKSKIINYLPLWASNCTKKLVTKNHEHYRGHKKTVKTKIHESNAIAFRNNLKQK